MTKKEVALINDTIRSFQYCIKHSSEPGGFPLTEAERIDTEARMDALVWVLLATGNAEGVDPDLLPEEFGY